MKNQALTSIVINLIALAVIVASPVGAMVNYLFGNAFILLFFVIPKYIELTTIKMKTATYASFWLTVFFVLALILCGMVGNEGLAADAGIFGSWLIKNLLSLYTQLGINSYSPLVAFVGFISSLIFAKLI